jgi:hypothetical protein
VPGLSLTEIDNMPLDLLLHWHGRAVEWQKRSKP